MLTCFAPCLFFCHSQVSAKENSTEHCPHSCGLAGVRGRECKYLIMVTSSEGFIDRLRTNQYTVGLLQSCLLQAAFPKCL